MNLFFVWEARDIALILKSNKLKVMFFSLFQKHNKKAEFEREREEWKRKISRET